LDFEIKVCYCCYVLDLSLWKDKCLNLGINYEFRDEFEVCG